MNLKQRLSQTDILVAPGVYDALTASLAQQAGFEALYLYQRQHLHQHQHLSPVAKRQLSKMSIHNTVFKKKKIKVIALLALCFLNIDLK